MKKNYTSKVFQVAITLLSFALIYLPILIIFIISIHHSQYNYEEFGITFKWYGEIFSDNQLVDAIVVTLQVAVLSTIISTTLGTLFAIGINGLRKKYRLRMMVMNNLPVVNPDIVTGILLFMIFRFLRISFGFPTMLLAHVFFSIPFVVLSVLPKLKQLDPDMFDAALDLGATRFNAIVHVILPSIKVGIIAGALIAFTMSIDDFIISYFMKQGEFHNVSTLIYSRLGKRQISPNVFAYNTLIVFLTIGIMVIFNRLNRNPKKVKG
jgi:spermidine/putrescine transport system permease protein